MIHHRKLKRKPSRHRRNENSLRLFIDMTRTRFWYNHLQHWNISSVCNCSKQLRCLSKSKNDTFLMYYRTFLQDNQYDESISENVWYITIIPLKYNRLPNCNRLCYPLWDKEANISNLVFFFQSRSCSYVLKTNKKVDTHRLCVIFGDLANNFLCW